MKKSILLTGLVFVFAVASLAGCNGGGDSSAPANDQFVKKGAPAPGMKGVGTAKAPGAAAQ